MGWGRGGARISASRGAGAYLSWRVQGRYRENRIGDEGSLKGHDE